MTEQKCEGKRNVVARLRRNESRRKRNGDTEDFKILQEGMHWYLRTNLRPTSHTVQLRKTAFILSSEHQSAI
jgi:hypothetical protein